MVCDPRVSASGEHVNVMKGRISSPLVESQGKKVETKSNFFFSVSVAVILSRLLRLMASISPRLVCGLLAACCPRRPRTYSRRIEQRCNHEKLDTSTMQNANHQICIPATQPIHRHCPRTGWLAGWLAWKVTGLAGYGRSSTCRS